MLHQFLAKETMNRLEGPEKSLFECSPGVGREEQPPNDVVVQLKTGYTVFYFSVF